MAEGILKDMAIKENLDIQVKSAGTFSIKGDQAATNAIEVMKDLGIDISNHSSRLVTEDLIKESDLVLTMANSHKDLLLNHYPEFKEKIYTLNQYAYELEKDIADPFGGNKETYKRARDEIYKDIEKIVNDRIKGRE